MNENSTLGQILTWEWGSCTQSPLLIKAKVGVLKQTHGLRSCAKFCLHQFILLPSGGKKNKFCYSLDFCILQLTVYKGSWTQLQNVSLSNGVKTVSVLQCLQGKIMHTNSVIHKPVIHKGDG